MLDDRASRVAAFVFAGVALLILAVICLVPIAAPIDPAEGAEQTVRLLVLSVLAVSSLFGAAGLMMFIRAFCALTGRGIASRKSAAAVGVLVALLATSLLAGSRSHGPTVGLWLFILGILGFYAGGGFLLISVTRLPRPTEELEN